MAKDGKKSFRTEFKEFITRGNVMDMAVGVIIGSAFTAIVTALVDKILNPIIGYFVGGVNFSDLKFELPQTIPGTQAATIEYGAFIQSVVNFLIVAFVIFCMIKFIGKLHRKQEEAAEEAPAEPEVSPEVQMLTEIRDLLKANSASACTADEGKAAADEIDA